MQTAKWPFFLMLIVACAWTSWLYYMDVTVADPVVVSAPQLHMASLVVVGDVKLEGDQARVKVSKIYKDGAQLLRQKPLPGELLVNWSKSFPTPTSEPFLLALKPSPGVDARSLYDVVPVHKIVSRKHVEIPVVYVMNESVRLQAERILGAN